MRLDVIARTLAKAQLARPWWFLGAGLVTTAIALAIVGSILHIDSSYEALLPRDTPELRNVHEVSARTGGTRQLFVAIEGGTPEKRIEFGRRLAQRLEQLDRVRQVDLELPVSFLEKRALWLLPDRELDEILEPLEGAEKLHRENGDPEGYRYAWGRVLAALERGRQMLPKNEVFTSRDGRYTFLVVVPSILFYDLELGAGFIKQIEAEVAALEPERQGLTVTNAGNLQIVIENKQTLTQDLRNASALALVLGILVVALLTRRPFSPIAIGMSLIAGVIWTGAFASLAVGHLNIITGFLIAVLIGLGIDFGIHLYVRFRQELEATGCTLDEAINGALVGTLPPALTSALTTSATFFSFSISEFRGFSEFGLIAGVGVLLTMASAFLFLPPLLIAFHKKRRETQASTPRLMKREGKGIPLPLALTVATIFVMAAIYGSAHLSIPFRNDFRELAGHSKAREFSQYIRDNLGSSFNPAVVVTSSVDDARRVGDIIREHIGDSPGDGPTVAKVLSLADLLPRGDLEQRQAKIDRLRHILEDPALNELVEPGSVRARQLAKAKALVDAQPWSLDDVPEAFTRRFTTIDGQGFLVYVWPQHEYVTDREAIAWERELDGLTEQIAAAGVRADVADETLIVAWVSRLVAQEGPRLLVIASIVVFLLLLLDTRSFRKATLVATPLVVGMLGLIALLHFLHILFTDWIDSPLPVVLKRVGELNLFNVVMLPTIIGIGIDNSVHIYHRYKREGYGSALVVVRNTGAAVLLASLTTAIGFGSALISHHVGLQTMAILAVLGISSTFIGSVMFFPCLLTLLERARRGDDGPRKTDSPEGLRSER